MSNYIFLQIYPSLLDARSMITCSFFEHVPVHPKVQHERVAAVYKLLIERRIADSTRCSSPILSLIFGEMRIYDEPLIEVKQQHGLHGSEISIYGI